MVIRQGALLFQSESQQHQFNFPYQLGAESDDLPEHAVLKDIGVNEGDVVVMGTDGLFDNVFPNEIVNIVSKTLGNEKNTKQLVEVATKSSLAELIAKEASKMAKSPRDSPFAKMAPNQWGFQGGKVDDITVIVALVSTFPRSKL